MTTRIEAITNNALKSMQARLPLFDGEFETAKGIILTAIEDAVAAERAKKAEPQDPTNDLDLLDALRVAETRIENALHLAMSQNCPTATDIRDDLLLIRGAIARAEAKRKTVTVDQEAEDRAAQGWRRLTRDDHPALGEYAEFVFGNGLVGQTRLQDLDHAVEHWKYWRPIEQPS